MHDLLKTSIYKNNINLFNDIEDKVNSFIERYVGYGVILQDDIFNIIQTFSKDIQFIRFPIKDSEICGFICNYKEKSFIYINTYLPLEKQIYTAAHELFHLIYNLDQLDVTNHLIKDEDLEIVENEQQANLFAALLLVPKMILIKKLEIMKIDSKNIETKDIIKLMDIFAVPYKTIVLRLFEIGFIKEKNVNDLLSIPDRDEKSGILYEIKKYEIGLRWQERTQLISYGELKSLIIDNDEEELITLGRAKKDNEYIKGNLREIFNRIGEKFD